MENSKSHQEIDEVNMSSSTEPLLAYCYCILFIATEFEEILINSFIDDKVLMFCGRQTC